MIRYLAQTLLFLAPVTAMLSAAQTVQAQTSPDIPLLEEYGRLPVFEDAAISANGTRRAQLINLKDSRYVFLYENGKSLRKIKLGNVKIRDLRWAGDDYLLIRISETQKLGNRFTTDKFELWRTLVVSAAPNSKVQFVFEKQHDILDSTVGFFGLRQIGGETYLYTGGNPLERVGSANRTGTYIFRGGGFSLYQVNLRTMKVKRMSKPPGLSVSRDWIVGADGEVAVTLDYNRESGQFDIRNAGGKRLVKERIGAAYRLFRWAMAAAILSTLNVGMKKTQNI